MAKFAKTLIAAGVLAASAMPAMAADYSDNIHKNDYKWMQFNVMHTIDQRPVFTEDGSYNDTYFEMEFGGRSGIFDLYGYVDVFDIFDSKDSDKHDGDNLFMKFAPRMSLDGLTGKDFSFGNVQELYIASVMSIGGSESLNESLVGLGADVNLPVLGKVGMNLYKRHVNEGDASGWDGQQFSMNWFKPFHNFANGSFLAYQGYVDYAWGMNKTSHSDGLGTFHGIYWHSERYAVGYGLKYFNEIYGIDNNAVSKSTGFGHYFAATYKF
ncbi:MAG: outer membrane protein OmpK [Cetobacterium sp.]